MYLILSGLGWLAKRLVVAALLIVLYGYLSGVKETGRKRLSVKAKVMTIAALGVIFIPAGVISFADSSDISKMAVLEVVSKYVLIAAVTAVMLFCSFVIWYVLKETLPKKQKEKKAE